MFPLHQGNKLVFQISAANPHHQNSSEDRILGHGTPDGSSSIIPNNSNNIGNNRRRKLVVAALDQTVIENLKDNKKKKMIHRENEKQRRLEMASLYSSLRSLLPLEFIKGKRSTSDHMNEAVKYIKHLQNTIKTLDAKRDELKIFPAIATVIDRRSTTTGSSSNSDQVNLPSCFTVQPSCGGVQILVSSGFREDGLPLISISSVLGTLLEQGLAVVSCLSSQVNETLLHNIQTEVNDVETLDLPALEQKLAKVVPTSRSTISDPSNTQSNARRVPLPDNEECIVGGHGIGVVH